MRRQSTSLSPQLMLAFGAVAALASATTVGFGSSYRDQRARARKAVSHYAGVARRRIRKERWHDRLSEPGTLTVLAVVGFGLAAACARMVMHRRGRSPFARAGGYR